MDISASPQDEEKDIFESAIQVNLKFYRNFIFTKFHSNKISKISLANYILLGAAFLFCSEVPNDSYY